MFKVSVMQVQQIVEIEDFLQASLLLMYKTLMNVIDSG